MPKNKPQPVNPPHGSSPHMQKIHQQEPLSGSKNVKNANHSHAKHGEGS